MYGLKGGLMQRLKAMLVLEENQRSVREFLEEIF